VASTVSSEEKAKLAREAGAELVVNYRTEDAMEAIRAWAPDGVERIVEVAVGGNAELDAEVIAPDRAITSYGAPDKPIVVPRPLMVKNGAVRFVLVYTMGEAATRQAVEGITAALGAGALTALPAVRFPLEQIEAAHDAVRDHAVGKVLIDIP
jgi:NADPH2:quinone reductase